MVLEELTGLINGHLENVRDILAVVPYFQSLTVISLTLTDVACDVDVRKEMHLDLVNAISCSGFASAALGVERKSSCLISSLLRVRCLSVELTDKIENPYISRRIAPGGPSDRRLVDTDYLIKRGITCYGVALDTGLPCPVELM